MHAMCCVNCLPAGTNAPGGGHPAGLYAKLCGAFVAHRYHQHRDCAAYLDHLRSHWRNYCTVLYGPTGTFGLGQGRLLGYDTCVVVLVLA
jgi:hypothetical protein